MSKAIKVIDLLNKIANGEEAPKKIKYNDEEYHTNIFNTYYFDDNNGTALNFENLNDEVEIIEEEPEIDIQGIVELDKISEFNTTATIGNHFNKINELVRAIKQLDNQINNK